MHKTMTSNKSTNKSTTSSTATKVTTPDPKTPSSPVVFSQTNFTRPDVLLFTVVLVAFVIFFTFLMFRGNSTSTCRTKACLEAGKMLQESINFTVAPCDDFYEFACGNWVALNPIPDEKSLVSTFERLGEKLILEMRQLLEQKPKKSSVAKSVQFAVDLYRECMDQKTRNTRGLKPLQHLINQSLGSSWPILDIDQVKGQGNFMETFTKVKNAGASPIVSFGVSYDSKQVGVKIIEFSAPIFGLGRHEFANQTEHNGSITAYRKWMFDYGKLFAGQDVDENMLKTRLEEIFEFDSKLALFTRRKEELRDASVWYNKMSLAQFKANTSNHFDWTAFLNLHIAPLNLSYRFNETDLVIVEDVAYYQQMVKLVKDTPTGVLHNYMGWMVASAWSSAMDSQLRAIDFAYATATTGVKKMVPDWKRCVSQVNGQLSWAVSQLYVDQLVINGTKERAEEMISDLRAAFKEIVQNEAKWLDATTRRRTLEKADATQYYVAYPDWIHDNAEVDGHYGFSEKEFAKVTEGKYFEAFVEMMQFNKAKCYREFHMKRNATLAWPMTPATINALAGLSFNTISLPAAVLRPPFFDPGRPAYLNYGAIGAVIGHEITHHFDDEGSQYDKTGNLVNWWSEETKKRFENGSHCFIQQYSEIVVDKVTEKKLNGINTQGENIADNGGIREAFLAFKSLAAKGPLPLVPQMESFTPSQLFFLAWAKVWCNNERPLSQVKNIDSGVHAPGKYRVNVPLGNFDQFAKAFNCPTGSNMNPKKKCHLW